MPKYSYVAQNEKGKKSKGVRNAADETELYQSLRSENLFLVSSRALSETKARKRIKIKYLAEFCRELGTLQKAGVSLVRALGIIAEEENIKKEHREVYLDLQRQIRQGVSLSDAMEAQEGAFPDLMVEMFRSAEASGRLEQTAFRMANLYEKEYRLTAKVRNAMIYPCVLAVLVVAVVIIIFTFVLPQFSTLFDQMESLPATTEFLMWFSDFIVNHWLLIAIVIFVVVVALNIIFRIPAVRYWRDKRLVKMRFVGPLLQVIYTARFARTLSSLYSSGLQIVTALQTGRKTVGNQYIDRQFDRVIARVRAGENLSAALGDVDGFVKKFTSTIMIGEETGSLDTMLDATADQLEYDSEIAINRLVALMEPIMIIVMAVIVGVIMISVIQPIYSSYDAIGAGYL